MDDKNSFTEKEMEVCRQLGIKDTNEIDCKDRALIRALSHVDIAAEKGLKQITDEGEIVKIANAVLDENPDIIKQYKNGKTNMVNYLVGQVMKKTGGKANPSLARDVMAKEIEKR